MFFSDFELLYVLFRYSQVHKEGFKKSKEYLELQKMCIFFLGRDRVKVRVF